MIIIAIGLLGLVLGSFVNALVWRLQEQDELKEHSSKKGRNQATQLTVEDLSITKGRSMCPECHHTLAAKDLVPLFSWLFLGGKCRYCKTNISWQYPVVEVFTAGLFALAYATWPLAFHGVSLFQFVYCLLFIVFFMALAVYDLRWFLLPDRLVFPLIGLAVVEVLVVALWQQSWAALWQPAAGAAIIFGLFYGLFQVSKGAWIGGGDVKLVLALGLIAASPLRALLVIFFASLLGTLASVPLLAKGKKNLKVHIPFGPYLLLATFIVLLYGTKIVDWYTQLFLPS